MEKFLYITDQNEYTDNSFIGPLFEKYLSAYFDVNILYFSQYKSDFERKDEKSFILPKKLKNNLLDELQSNGIDVDAYAYIVVRNDTSILKHILNRKIKHNYKVGYRLSFPKRVAKLQVNEANNKSSFLEKIKDKIESFTESNLINECDIFLPTSKLMQDEYLKSVETKSFILPPAIDPEVLHENIQHVEDHKRFFYAGTLDNLRQFDVILEAFNQTNNNQFRLMISTKDPQYAKELVEKYPNLKNCIELYNANTKQELLELISKADIGVSILPNIALFNSSTPVKILDYYSSAVPCIMTNNANNSSLFEDDYNAWFCDFTIDSIKNKIEHVISLSKDEVAQVGVNGQKRLLAIRNYDKIAHAFAHQLSLL